MCTGLKLDEIKPKKRACFFFTVDRGFSLPMKGFPNNIIMAGWPWSIYHVLTMIHICAGYPRSAMCLWCYSTNKYPQMVQHVRKVNSYVSPRSMMINVYHQIFNLVGGLEHFLFFHSVGIFIIPTDELHDFSEGLVETTNQIIINHHYPYNNHI